MPRARWSRAIQVCWGAVAKGGVYGPGVIPGAAAIAPVACGSEPSTRLQRPWCCGQPYTRGCDCWLQSSSPHYTPQMPPNTTHPTSPLARSRETGNTCGREVSRHPDVTPYAGRWRSPTCISESTRRSTLYTWDTPRREPKALGREIGAWRRRGWRNTLRGTRARGRAKGFRMQRLRYMEGSGCRIYTLIKDSLVVEGKVIGVVPVVTLGEGMRLSK